MSLPKLERNKALVRLRKKNPKKWTWEALRIEFKFKSRNSPVQIYNTFKDKF